MEEHLLRVLIAEDLDVLREHFAAIINQQPDMQTVGTVCNGKQAVQEADTLAPDLILMDIEMDCKHDGIYAAKQITAAHPGIKVLFLTIHEDDDTVFSAFENGAVDYINKSAPPEEIIAAIRLAVQGRSPIRPEIAAKIRTEFSRIRKNESHMMESIYLISRLTATEQSILSLLLQDKRPAEIAALRQVELSTVKTQINQLLKKFNKNRTKEIVKLVKELNLNELFFRLNHE
jgi:DNA-binding NarL/FixJ family response regulator